MVRVYSTVIAIGLGALSFGLWNGLQRGHWFALGLATVTVTTANMAVLLRQELRKTRPQ